MDVKCGLCGDEIILDTRIQDYLEVDFNVFICVLCVNRAKKRILNRELEKMIEEKQ